MNEQQAELAKRAVQVAATPHASVAADVWPEGGTLRCTGCGHELRFTQADAARYLRDGWPKCCGWTMVLREKLRK